MGRNYQKLRRDYRDVEGVLKEPQHKFPERKVNTVPESWQQRDLHKRRAAAEEVNRFIEALLED